MRRALLLFLAALPALALGQSVTLKTSTNANLTVVNKAQCQNAQFTDVQLNDDMSADITWTSKPSTTASGSGGVYRIYVTTTEPQAGMTVGGNPSVDCTRDVNSNQLNPPQIGPDITFTGTTQTQTDVSFASLISGAGLNCSSAAKTTFYICIQQVSGSTAIGYAKASFTLDTTSPVAPTNRMPSPGDGALHLDCGAGSGDTVGTGGGYKAKATPTDATLPPKYSSESTSCSDLVITGLTNNQAYDVVVYRLNENHNPSAPSASVTGTPVVTSDYWNDYKDSGGREAGGCNTGAGAAGLLGALSILVAFRRRKS